MSIFTKFLNNNHRRNCVDCKEAKLAFIEYAANLHVNNEKYTSLVLSLGYVLYVSLLTTTFKELYNIGKWFWVGSIIFLVISLGLFIGYEIWKVKIFHSYEEKILKEIDKVLDENIAFSYVNMKQTIAKISNKHFSQIIDSTNRIFIISVSTAFISCLLFAIVIGIAFSKL